MRAVKIGRNIMQPTGYKAFILDPFPPKEGFYLSSALLKKDIEATRLLGKLDGIMKLLPDPDFFLLMYTRKDATSSSQIEGTQATMINLIEAEGKIESDLPPDVDDIIHYIKALNYGLNRVSKDDFPITLRFIRELHKVLMKKARSTHFSTPGEFRKSQNWIGGTRPDNATFVPPPAYEMGTALSELEKFIHNKDIVPLVIKAGIIHAQFETIHPFLDGNGRTGRLLINFCLWRENLLEKPILFLSSYFRNYQKIYYERLKAYHDGHIDAWLDFFLDGVIEVTKEAIDIVGKITELRERDMRKIQSLGKRASESAMQVVVNLYKQPIVNTAIVMKWTKFTRAAAKRVINRLIELGILKLREKDTNYANTYIYTEYLNIF